MISQPRPTPKRDPFYVDPPPKAHYHPSEKKNLSEKQKKTSISPIRSSNRKWNEEERLSYNDELFLKGGNSFTPKANQDESGSSHFDESWPSTDRPLSITDEDHPLNNIIFQNGGDRYGDLKKTLQFPERDPAADKRKSNLMSQNGNMRQDSSSTLQKYIERFRSGQPMSREERQKASSSAQRDFWWLSDRSHADSSTPKEDSPGAKRSRRFTPHSPISPYKGHDKGCGYKKPELKDFAPHTLDDTTKLLQEKADRLLDSASSVASSDPIVSTDGLGSSQSFSSTINSVEEQPYRPSFARKWDKQEKPSYQIPKPQGRQPSGPEEDVLYQWRLKRKVEQARDNASKTPAVKFGYNDKSPGQKEIDQKLDEFKQRLSGRGNQQSLQTDEYKNPNGRYNTSDSHYSSGTVQFTPAPQVRGQIQHSHDMADEPQKSFPIASPMLPKKSADEIEPHYHLTCDLLPCSHQGHQTHQQSQNDFRRGHETNSGGNNSKNASTDSKVLNRDKDIDSDRYKFLQAEKPDIEEKVESESRTSRSGDDEQDKKHVTDEDNDSFETDKSSKLVERESKQNVRTQIQKESESKVKRKIIKDNEKLTEKEVDRNIPSLKKSGKPTYSKPVVDNAIGQVVKDRLFNISTSTVLSSIDSDISPPRQPKFTVDSQQQNKENREESYESDGEYPDDQLLHMLRQQRAQYEEQLRHIDDMLARLDLEDS